MSIFNIFFFKIVKLTFWNCKIITKFSYRNSNNRHIVVLFFFSSFCISLELIIIIIVNHLYISNNNIFKCLTNSFSQRFTTIFVFYRYPNINFHVFLINFFYNSKHTFYIFFLIQWLLLVLRTDSVHFRKILEWLFSKRNKLTLKLMLTSKYYNYNK